MSTSFVIYFGLINVLLYFGVCFQDRCYSTKMDYEIQTESCLLMFFFFFQTFLFVVLVWVYAVSRTSIVWPLNFIDVNYTISVISFFTYCTFLSTQYIRLFTFDSFLVFLFHLGFLWLSLLLTKITRKLSDLRRTPFLDTWIPIQLSLKVLTLRFSFWLFLSYGVLKPC